MNTVSALLTHLRKRGNDWALYLTESSSLRDTDEIALIPIPRRL